ncbi:TPA: hypothetical protein ACJHCE_005190, partial [Escherichia coli]
LRLRLTVDLLWIPTRLVCNLRQAPGGTRHHNSHCFGGTSLYTCFRLVPLFLQNREEHHRTTGS